MAGRELREVSADPSRDPVPSGIRSGNLIYCGHIAGTDPVNGDLPDSLDAQLRNVFRNMQTLVERAGGTIDTIARVGLFLRQLGDLTAVNEHWIAMFPNAEDRPTYKFLQTDLPERCQIQLDFFAVAGARRRLLAIPGVAHTNPIPLAVTIGPMLFSSRILPSDVEKGQYGETPERQAELSFAHARRLVELAGGSVENICQIRAFVKEPAYRQIVDEQVRCMFPNGRPRVEMLHYPTGGALQVMIEIIAGGLPNGKSPASPKAEDDVQEVFEAGGGSPAPAGVRIGDIVFLAPVDSRDPATGAFVGDLEAQFRQALGNMKGLLGQAGAGLENVARVTVFDDNPGDHTVLNRVWEALYPDYEDRPPRKVLQAGLELGSLLKLSVLAVMGGKRRELSIPGHKGHDPSIAIGSYVFTARVPGTEPETGELGETLERQAQLAVHNAVAFAESAGGSAADVTQVVVFMRDPGHMDLVREAYRQKFGGVAQPVFYPMTAYLSPGMNFMGEIIAAR